MFVTFLLALVLPCPGLVLAYPVSSKSTVAAETYIPLIILSIFLLFVLVAIKAIYMKYRRIGTIHAPHGTRVPAGSNLSPSTSTLGLRDKPGNRYRGLLVGFLGSPTWETSLMPKLDGWRREQRRGSSFAYQRHTGSTMGSTRSAFARTKFKKFSSSSRFTKSTVTTSSYTDASRFVPPLPSSHARVPSRSLGSVRRNGSTGCRPCCGDFGESYGATLGGSSLLKGVRRASSSSVRSVDGPSQSSQVEYSFLSGLPPDAIVLSPLMSARDSFQLSRCSLKCNRQPVPPLPLLPLFVPFHLPKDCVALEPHSPKGSGPLPLANVFHAQRPILERRVPSSRTPVAGGRKGTPGSRAPCAASESRSISPTPEHATRAGSAAIQDKAPSSHPIEDMSKHKESKSYRGLAIQGSFLQSILLSDGGAADEWHCHGNVDSGNPLEPWEEQNSLVPPIPLVCTPSTCTGQLISPRTPMSDVDVDIGMIGLDRFHWSDDLDEIKVPSSHIKKDSVALVPHWD